MSKKHKKEAKKQEQFPDEIFVEMDTSGMEDFGDEEAFLSVQRRSQDLTASNPVAIYKLHKVGKVIQTTEFKED